MGFKTIAGIRGRRGRRTQDNVRRVFDRLLKAERPRKPAGLPPEFEGAEEDWKKLLAAHSFRDPEKAFRVLREFVEGPGYVHVSPRTTELARQLILRLFALCPKPRPTAPATRRSRRSACPTPTAS